MRLEKSIYAHIATQPIVSTIQPSPKAFLLHAYYIHHRDTPNIEQWTMYVTIGVDSRSMKSTLNKT